MPLSAAFQLSLLELILDNTAIANVGNAGGVAGSSGSGSPGNLYVALHTASPGDGTQNTNEAAYPGYARVAVSRAGSAWSFAGSDPSVASNAAAVQFPAATTGADETETYFSIGVASSGATEIIAYAPLQTNLLVTPAIVPTFAPGQLNFTAD